MVIRSTATRLLKNAKRAWILETFASISMLIASILSGLGNEGEQQFFWVTAGLLILAEAASIDKDWWHVRADEAARHADLAESFGWESPRGEIADLVAEFGATPSEPYFASKQPDPVRRALENLLESTFFSRHIATRAANWSLIAFCVLLLATVGLLSVAAVALSGNQNSAQPVARLAISVMVSVVTMGALRAQLRYRRFARAAGDIERTARRALEDPAPSLIESYRLWSEYHASRAAGPLLPAWIWRLTRSRLDEALRH